MDTSFSATELEDRSIPWATALKPLGKPYIHLSRRAFFLQRRREKERMMTKVFHKNIRRLDPGLSTLPLYISIIFSSEAN